MGNTPSNTDTVNISRVKKIKMPQDEIDAKIAIDIIEKNGLIGSYGPGDSFSGRFYEEWIKLYKNKGDTPDVSKFGLVFKIDNKTKFCLVDKKKLYVIHGTKAYVIDLKNTQVKSILTKIA